MNVVPQSGTAWCFSSRYANAMNSIGMNAITNSDRRLGADGEHDEAERRDEGVDGCGGGEPDDDVAHEAEGAGLQALVADGRGFGFLDCHVRKYTV